MNSRRGFLASLLGLLLAPLSAAQQWMGPEGVTISYKQGEWHITGTRASLRSVQDAVGSVVTNFGQSDRKPTIIIDGIDIYWR